MRGEERQADTCQSSADIFVRNSLSSAEGQVIEGVTEIKFFEGNEPMYLTPDPPAQTRHSHLRQKQKRVARPVDQWTAVDRLTEEVPCPSCT